MKKLLFIPICCLFACIVWSQNADTLNQKDVEGRKQGHWIYYGSDRPESGIPADGKVEEGSYVNDRKEGLWIKYHLDGKTPKIKGEYKNNRPEGAFTKFYANGLPKEKGHFVNKNYSDTLYRYYENGSIQRITVYNSAGQEHGFVQEFNTDGTIFCEYYVTNDIFPGEPPCAPKTIICGISSVETKQNNIDSNYLNTYPPSVETTVRTLGVKWQPNGYNKVYNQDDEIWQDGIFKEGKLWDGKVYTYDQDGILLNVRIYKSGIYHSDGQL